MDATLARAEIVTWLEIDCLDPASERRRAREQVGVRRPHCSLDDRFIIRVTNEIAQQRYAIEAKSAEGVRHTRHLHERT